MIAEGMSGSELYSIKEEIYALEQEITNEVTERTSARDKELEMLIKQRQELMKTGAAPEDLKSIENQIAVRMRATGVDEETIEKTLELFRRQRSYDEGGWVQETGPAIVHKGEFVLSKDMLKSLEQGGSINEMADSVYQAQKEQIKNEYNQYQYINQNLNNSINNAFNIHGSDAMEVLNKIEPLIMKKLPAVITTTLKKEGLDLNKIRK
jgi:hypothetical protein